MRPSHIIPILLMTAGVCIWSAGCEEEFTPEEKLAPSDTWEYDSLVTVTDELGIILSIDENDWDYHGQYEIGDTIPALFAKEGMMIPTRYEVYPPYPNPVQSDTVVYFHHQLPEQSQVHVYLFNAEGDTMTLCDGMRDAGRYTQLYDVALLRAGYYHCVFNFENITIEGDILVDTTTTSISKQVSKSF